MKIKGSYKNTIKRVVALLLAVVLVSENVSWQEITVYATKIQESNVQTRERAQAAPIVQATPTPTPTPKVGEYSVIRANTIMNTGNADEEIEIEREKILQTEQAGQEEGASETEKEDFGMINDKVLLEDVEWEYEDSNIDWTGWREGTYYWEKVGDSDIENGEKVLKRKNDESTYGSSCVRQRGIKDMNREISFLFTARCTEAGNCFFFI